MCGNLAENHRPAPGRSPIPRMKGTAERQTLPPAFMRGEGHEVAWGVPRRGGDGPLSHGFAVPALPKGEPRGLRSDHRLLGGILWDGRKCGNLPDFS